MLLQRRRCALGAPLCSFSSEVLAIAFTTRRLYDCCHSAADHHHARWHIRLGCLSRHAAFRRLYDPHDALSHVEFHLRSVRDSCVRVRGLPIENVQETDTLDSHVGYYRSHHVNGYGETEAGRSLGEVGGGLARLDGFTDLCPVLGRFRQYSAGSRSAEPQSHRH